MKTKPSKSKIFLWKFIPIIHSFIYHYQKAKKSWFEAQKSWKVLNLMRIFIDSLAFMFHSDKVLFRFVIDRILFRDLSDRVLFESSEIGSSSLGSAVIDSSLHHCYDVFSAMSLFFYQIVFYYFNQKEMFCFVFKTD